ncbi:hypothetical protein NQZ68_040387 [Dissostichus eleginoides]|nr:hypothetical protein NQZ68_040387 [Dissostichus eleginoides]
MLLSFIFAYSRLHTDVESWTFLGNGTSSFFRQREVEPGSVHLDSPAPERGSGFRELQRKTLGQQCERAARGVRAPAMPYLYLKTVVFCEWLLNAPVGIVISVWHPNPSSDSVFVLLLPCEGLLMHMSMLNEKGTKMLREASM